MVSSEYMTPDGLFGEFIMTAETLSSSISLNFSKSIWKSSIRGGTIFGMHPAPVIYGTYSGKKGANTMTEDPASHTALRACASAPAAPVVMKI